eukprot:5776589-Pleurochrysis_carterae.AAC.1
MSSSIVSCAIQTVIPNALHINIIRDAVRRTNAIVSDASELIATHLARCYDPSSTIQPPTVDAAFVKKAMQVVSTIDGKHPIEHPELNETREKYSTLSSSPLTSRSRLDQVLTFQADAYAKNFQTNLTEHFLKRVKKFVSLRLNERLLYVLADDVTSGRRTMAEARRDRNQRIMLIALDVSQPKTCGYRCDDEYHASVQHLRDFLYSNTPKASSPQHAALQRLFHATVLMNKEFENSGMKLTSAWPIRRGATERCITIDTKALQCLMELGGAEEDKKRTNARVAAKKRSMEKKKALLKEELEKRKEELEENEYRPNKFYNRRKEKKLSDVDKDRLVGDVRAFVRDHVEAQRAEWQESKNVYELAKRQAAEVRRERKRKRNACDTPPPPIPLIPPPPAKFQAQVPPWHLKDRMAFRIQRCLRKKLYFRLTKIRVRLPRTIARQGRLLASLARLVHERKQMIAGSRKQWAWEEVLVLPTKAALSHRAEGQRPRAKKARSLCARLGIQYTSGDRRQTSKLQFASS